MSDKAFFKTKSIISGKWDYLKMIKESIHQETIMIINVYIPVCFFFFLTPTNSLTPAVVLQFNSIDLILILTIQTWYNHKS